MKNLKTNKVVLWAVVENDGYVSDTFKTRKLARLYRDFKNAMPEIKEMGPMRVAKLVVTK